MNKKPIVQMWEKLGLLPQQIAEEWWIKTAALLCEKAEQSGVTAFSIQKVNGKWAFEINAEEQPDSHTEKLSRAAESEHGKH